MIAIMNRLWIKFKNIIQMITILILICIIGFQRRCTPSKIETVYQKIITPEIKGTFDTIKNPQPIKTDIQVVYNTEDGDTIFVDGPINLDLVKQFEKSKDENEKLKQYIASIKQHSYTVPFEDDNVKISNYIETQGELLKIVPSYIIKPRVDSVKIKTTNFAMLGGIELANNTKFDNPNVKATLYFQNKKGNLISAGYDTNKNIYVGYTLKLFEHKK